MNNLFESVEGNSNDVKKLLYQYQKEEDFKNTKALKINGKLYINNRILKDYALNSEDYKIPNKKEWLKYIAFTLICPIFWFMSSKHLETFIELLMEIDFGLSFFIIILWMTMIILSIGIRLIICPFFFYTNIRKRKIFKEIIPSLLKETQPFIPYERETKKIIRELNLEDIFIKDDFDILIEDYDKKYTL